jgi:hypothetical protein
MGDQPIPQTELVTPPTDAGLRCPQCDYNLTGLSNPRCPECGQKFNWDQVRRAAANPPRIFFERVHGWRKVPGFFVTWATVLFAPWVFARQWIRRVSAVHAVAFGAVCFGSTSVALLFGCERAFLATWLTTAVIYIVLQAVCLSLLDVSGWRRPFATLRLWLLVGCYTSAVMMTEFVQGPPHLTLWDLRASTGEMYRLSTESVTYWAQIGVWVIGLVCCYVQRLRRKHASLCLVALAAVFMASSIVALYAATIEYIGVRLCDWYGC